MRAWGAPETRADWIDAHASTTKQVLIDHLLVGTTKQVLMNHTFVGTTTGVRPITQR